MLGRIGMCQEEFFVRGSTWLQAYLWERAECLTRNMEGGWKWKAEYRKGHRNLSSSFRDVRVASLGFYNISEENTIEEAKLWNKEPGAWWAPELLTKMCKCVRVCACAVWERACLWEGSWSCAPFSWETLVIHGWPPVLCELQSLWKGQGERHKEWARKQHRVTQIKWIW